MEKFGVGVFLALSAFIGLVLYRARRDRWANFCKVADRVGATEDARGWMGSDYLERDGRHGGKRFRLFFYLGSEHYPAHLTFHFLVRGPSLGELGTEGPWDGKISADDMRRLLALGVTRIQVEADGVQGSLEPAQLSDPGLADRAAAVLPALEKLTRGYPALDWDRTVSPVKIPAWSLFAEVAGLGVAIYFLYHALIGQTPDTISAFLHALPFGVAVVVLRDWIFRRQNLSLSAVQRGPVRKALWGLYGVAVLMGWYAGNQRWDRGEAKTLTVTVVDKRHERQKFRSVPVLRVESWVTPGRWERLEVNEAEFAAAGSRVEIVLRSGLFGVPWIERYRIL